MSKKGKKSKKPVTKKPSGLDITRVNTDNFKFSWKRNGADAKDGQWCEYRKKTKSKWGDWNHFTIKVWNKKKKTYVTTTNLGPSISDRTLDLNKNDYHPFKSGTYLNEVEFRVKTDQDKKKAGTDPKASKYKSKSFKISAPYNPTIEATFDGTNLNRTTFKWQAYDDQHHWLTKTVVEERRMLEGQNAPNFTVVSNSPSGEVVRTEDNSVLAKTSIIRQFRITSYGPGGTSKTLYASHAYGRPFQAVVYKEPVMDDKGNVKTPPPYVNVTEADGMICTLFWNSKVNDFHPIDKTVVEYGIAVPERGLKCPDSVNWQTGAAVYDTSDDDGATFSIDGVINEDQLLYVRVNNYHDTESSTTYGTPVLVSDGLTFFLKDPMSLSIPYHDETTCRIRIQVTNRSEVEDSFIAVLFRSMKKDETTGETSISTEIIHVFSGGQSEIIQCPNWHDLEDFSIGVRAYVGDYTTPAQVDAGFGDGTTYEKYDIPNPKMISKEEKWEGGDIPKAPKTVNLINRGNGIVNVSWDWSWKYANTAELSWADHEDAWESTDEPSMYRIDGTHVPNWNIAGLEAGVKWYIRVRLIKVNNVDDTETAGPWSKLELGEGHSFIDLASAPNIPMLDIPSFVTTSQKEFTATWQYNSTDGYPQDYAEVTLATFDENEGTYTYGSEPIAKNEGENGGLQNLVINPFDEPLLWETGKTYYLAVRVRSASGCFSEWSAPQGITVVEPLFITVSTDLKDEPEVVNVEKTITTVDPNTGETTDSIQVVQETIHNYKLEKLPLNIEITGAGTNGYISAEILRDSDYHLDRPDEGEFNGFKDEIITRKDKVSDGTLTITLDDLRNGAHLDDTAKYRIVCSISDNYGQYEELPKPIQFVVDWERQALMPAGTAFADQDAYISVITPTKPEYWDETHEGDVCDIYRLSVDKPELIYENAEFDVPYVDPYPALGEYGGHRLVYKTIYGDYITGKDYPVNEYKCHLAWTDYGDEDDDIIDTPYNIIDFDGMQIYLLYNIDLQSSWSKDFKETKYLGGHIQGDWNAAVSRTGTVNTVSVTTLDQYTIQMMRRLATYPGICHIRTRDGSSYAADIQVSETLSHEPYELVSYTLNITRVDSQGLDGMTLEAWNDLFGDDDLDYDDIVDDGEPSGENENQNGENEGDGN